jgi:sarcosine oxidase, subunit gamma
MAEKRSPLGHLAEAIERAGSEAVRLREIPFLTQLNVRAADEPRPDIGAVLRLGPDEWLVVAPEDAAPELHGDAVVDVSGWRTTLELSGPRARDVLAKGCSLDLHPSVFGVGAHAQTLLAQAQAIVWLVDEEPVFRLLVRSSFAAYVATWLLDAMAEYALHDLDAVPLGAGDLDPLVGGRPGSAGDGDLQ